MRLKLFRAEVTGKAFVTPGLIRLTFGGDGLDGFASTGSSDEYIRLFFPDAETGELVAPDVDERGYWSYPEGKKPSHCEPYTVRRFDRDRRLLDVEFVAHEGGIASDWAQAAKLGDVLFCNEARGITTVPPDARWCLLACDATGLPALARFLEDLPAHVDVRVIAEIAEDGHRVALPERSWITVTWLVGTGNGLAPSHLLDAVRSVPLLEAPGFVWVAAEQRTVRPIRRHFRHQLQLPAARYSVTAYWTDRLSEWQAGWGGLDPAVKTQIEAAWSSGRDREEVADEVDTLLEKAGL